MERYGQVRQLMRRPGWLAQYPAVAGAVLLPLAGGWIGWWVRHHPLGAVLGAVAGLLVAVGLVVLVESG
ncbi:hypothetical protein [Kitasatospora herbaricolor]|uniref:hypothetical protein n=2 Tax=Streptomycetaceae TaxID=2062 RepID=UPI001748BF01|nr:hypothetical protein [Kitasatospora herbaricolor]MDQ0311411.1 ABC-type xylose transport system permease subunit [Kitasatospora herbaricolor]